MKVTEILRSNRVHANASAAAISAAGITGSAAYANALTAVIVTAGAAPPSEAIEYVTTVINGADCCISIVPAGIKLKLIVLSIGVIASVGLGYLAYKWVRSETESVKTVVEKTIVPKAQPAT